MAELVHRAGRGLALLLGTALLAACAATPAAVSTSPAHPVVGEPLPGQIHMVSDPADAPFSVTIRLDDVGGPARVGDEFAPGEMVLVDRSTLPGEIWIDVNGHDCDGRFNVLARVEIDVLLVFDDGSCAVRVLGSHPEGANHVGPSQS